MKDEISKTETKINNIKNHMAKKEDIVKGFEEALREMNDATGKMATKMWNLKADAIYSAVSDIVKSKIFDVEGIVSALDAGYYYVGNGYPRR